MIWKALTDPQLIRQYRFDTTVECDWKKGSSWKVKLKTGKMLL